MSFNWMYIVNPYVMIDVFGLNLEQTSQFKDNATMLHNDMLE